MFSLNTGGQLSDEPIVENRMEANASLLTMGPTVSYEVVWVFSCIVTLLVIFLLKIDCCLAVLLGLAARPRSVMADPAAEGVRAADSEEVSAASLLLVAPSPLSGVVVSATSPAAPNVSPSAVPAAAASVTPPATSTVAPGLVPAAAASVTSPATSTVAPSPVPAAAASVTPPATSTVAPSPVFALSPVSAQVAPAVQELVAPVINVKLAAAKSNTW